MTDYKNKYIKYKNKYLKLKGGAERPPEWPRKTGRQQLQEDLAEEAVEKEQQAYRLWFSQPLARQQELLQKQAPEAEAEEEIREEIEQMALERAKKDAVKEKHKKNKAEAAKRAEERAAEDERRIAIIREKKAQKSKEREDIAKKQIKRIKEQCHAETVQREAQERERRAHAIEAQALGMVRGDTGVGDRLLEEEITRIREERARRMEAQSPSSLSNVVREEATNPLPMQPIALVAGAVLIGLYMLYK